MRIGLIAPPWAPVPPALYGGIELVVDRLAQGFAAAGHDVVLFTTGDSACPVPRKWLLGHSEGDFPETERAAAENFAIPLWAGIDAAAQERVVSAVREAVTAKVGS